MSSHRSHSGQLVGGHFGLVRRTVVNHGEVEQAISLTELFHSEFGQKSYAVDRGVVYGV